MSENQEVQSASGAVKSVEDRIAALEKNGTWLSAVVRKVVSFLEKTFGYDINADGKIGSARVGLLAGVVACMVAISAFAAETNLWQLYNGDSVYGTAKVETDLAGAATLTVDKQTIKTSSSVPSSTAGAATIGDATIGTNVDLTVASITVTNGQIIVLTSTYTELLNTGTADTTTTNTFAALSAAQVGRLFYIQAAAANTDSIAFAEAGILVSGGTLTLGASDGFTAIARATNILRQATAVMNN